MSGFLFVMKIFIDVQFVILKGSQQRIFKTMSRSFQDDKLVKRFV
ncbi:hypothetical protein [Chryseobacterium sp. IHB B 17019]|nr:hypothetical protein [Chryseobacterium sp. IHB B 17019]